MMGFFTRLKQPVSVFFTLLIMPLFCIHNALADPSSMGELYQMTREPLLVQALVDLQSIGSDGESTLESLKAHQTHILFQTMAQLGPQYAGNDALSLVNQTTGQQIIYISHRHQTAPPQALAALIKHESMHHDIENSLLEEAAAWTEEGLMWARMKQQYPDLANIPIKMSPLVDRLNAILVLIQNDKLATEIVKNPAYKSLPMTSPCFETH